MGDEPGVAVVGVHAVEAVVLLIRGSGCAAEHASDGARGACDCTVASTTFSVEHYSDRKGRRHWRVRYRSYCYNQQKCRLTDGPTTGTGVTGMAASLVLVNRHELHKYFK